MRRCSRSSTFALVVCLTGIIAGLPNELEADKLPAAATKKIDFVKDVQPLLRSRCYSCHGPEEQESGLRLDLKQRAMEGGDNGRILLPKNSAESRLIAIVAGLDDEVGIMPPEGEGTPLTSDEIALLRAWIDQGVVWPESADGDQAASSHWSFQPIQQPMPPRVGKLGSWIKSPIDAFVAARLEKEGIEPSPPVDRATLIRRVYLDLLGLPPSPEQVEKFVTDSSDAAVERMIDEALESRHYGERWARHWLDLARYADSDGYEKDRPRPHAWRYRHWVIDALNADMSFDQFTIEQIAGDLLPEATIEQKVASGFHRNTLHNTEGGTDKEEDRVKKTVDRTNTVASIWLGLTLGCAQCHSHKYDPITQREYYSTYAFFNDINEVDVSAPLAEEIEKYNQAKRAFDADNAKYLKAIEQYKANELPKTQSVWEKTALTQKPIWQNLKLDELKSAKGAQFEQQDDASVLVTGKNALSDIYTLKATISEPTITAIRLEALPDDRLGGKGPGRSDHGNFVLAKFEASVSQGGGKPIPLKFKSARASHSQKEWEVAKAINGDTKNGWAIAPKMGERHIAVFDVEPIELDGEALLTIVLDQTYRTSPPHNLGRFRLSYTTTSGPIELDGVPQTVADALAVKIEARSDEQRKAIAAYYETVDPKLAELKASAAEFAKKGPKQSATKAQSVVNTGKRQARVHIRGDFLSPGDPVDKKTPSVLPVLEPEGAAPTRLDFARWLVDPSNPLTARVTVNRVWQRYFGRGLVPTSDDFGTQGDPPSHPLLLDWLASEFRNEGWSLKRLHKTILMSATYQQSSAIRKDLIDTDPENVLLARQSRLRVEAEVIRDLALAVSGLLSPKVGGPSVRPPQPAEYSAITYANSARWTESKGDDRYRRGLYTFFQRTSPYPMLMTFDAPDSTSCTAQRSTSNTPLQALTVWNDRVFWECAQQLGRRIVRDRPPLKDAEATNRDRITYAFQTCLSRQPDTDELNAVLELYRAQVKLNDADEARTLEIIGTAPQPEGATPAELAGWVAVGRVLINLDEFITRE